MKNIANHLQNIHPQQPWDFTRLYLSLPRSQKYLWQGMLALGGIVCLWQAGVLVAHVWPSAQNSNVITTVGSSQSKNSSIAISLEQYKPLQESTWFGSSLLLENQNVATENVMAETTLNLSLKGTIMGITPRAIIRDNSKSESHVLKEGEELLKGVTVSQIMRRRVMLNNKGKIEALSLPSSDDVFGNYQEEKVITEIDNPRLDITKQKPKDNSYIPLAKRPITKRHRIKIAKTELISAVANLGALSKQARLIPYVYRGKVEAFRVHKLQHDSFLRKLTLQDRDLIIKLDDIPIHDREKIFPMIMNMATATSAELVVQRQNEIIALQIEAD